MFVLVVMIGNLRAIYRERYCLPGSSCWPSVQDVARFGHTLSGSLVHPSSVQYETLVTMQNLRTTKYPQLVILAQNTGDVQKSILFARQYELKVTVLSSGHDYIGRSTGTGTMQINLSRMTNTSVNLVSSKNAAGEITLESGNTWGKVYREVSSFCIACRHFCYIYFKNESAWKLVVYQNC